MSKEYDNYILEHKNNVKKAYVWLQMNLPELFEGLDEYTAMCIDKQCLWLHDESKHSAAEYNAYDKYFYGERNKDGGRDESVVADFNKAWLHHIHHNPHHWQHWILNCDDKEEGEKLLPIPFEYIIEMICDWWSFSWKIGKLDEVFKWWESHKDYIKMNEESREVVESILKVIEGILKTKEKL